VKAERDRDANASGRYSSLYKIEKELS